MLKDVLHGLRSMAKNPGVTAIAVLTLALGIGANTAMFSVINAVLLRPLPYRDPGRLVTIFAQLPSRNILFAFVEYNTYAEWWRAHARSFESMWASSPVFMNLTSAGDPQRLLAMRVSGRFLSSIGARPALGRDFVDEEDRPGAPAVVMLSDKLWRRHFGGDRTVLGRAIQLDRKPYTVVAVLPPEFDFYNTPVDVYVPIAASTARIQGQPAVGVHARIRPGVSLAAAQAEIDGLCRGWVQQYHYPNDWGAKVVPLRDFYARDVHASVKVLAVAVGLILLIACANVANLLLARAGARQREMAIRAAMGAGRGRLIRQLLTESSLLGLISTALGFFAASGAVGALRAGSGVLPFQSTITIDAPVLWFTVAAALTTTLLFGLAPALAAAPYNLAENLKEGGRSGSEGSSRARLRSVLVVAEVALALLLALAATLTSRSLLRLQSVDPGFQADRVLTASVSLPRDSYADPGRRVKFFNTLLDRLNAMPGVKTAGMVSDLPFGGSKRGSDITVEGAPARRPGEQMIVFWRSMDPKYFQTLGVRLVRGRYFTPHDPTGPPVAMINEALARQGWPNQDPVGKRIGTGGNVFLTIIGVVADMRQTSLSDPPDLEGYMPYSQQPSPGMALAVRTSMDPIGAAPAIRAAVRELDRDLPISEISALSESVSHSMLTKRISTSLLGGFAALALLLASVGIYGVVSYSVARQTHEIGVRMALGAERSRIARTVVGRALLLALAGVILGDACGLALMRLLRTLLYGVSATDPAIFTGASLFLLMVAALAAYIPARRAARVDPMVALRHE